MTKLIRPIMYFCRRGVNDVFFIIQRIKCIPEGRRREVSNHYEKLLRPNDGCAGRKEANEYLDGVASEYRTERKPVREIKLKTPVKPKSTAREYKSKCRLWSKELN